jgi:hypothetical protein
VSSSESSRLILPYVMAFCYEAFPILMSMPQATGSRTLPKRQPLGGQPAPALA